MFRAQQGRHKPIDESVAQQGAGPVVNQNMSCRGWYLGEAHGNTLLARGSPLSVADNDNACNLRMVAQGLLCPFAHGTPAQKSRELIGPKAGA